MSAKTAPPSAKIGNAAGLEGRLKPTYHVIARQDRWSVTRRGAQRASRVFASQPEAVTYAVKIAASAAIEVVVHNKDGSVARRIAPSVKSASK
jgi:uncharacterized protein YdaT